MSIFSFAGRIPELYIAALGALKARAVFSALLRQLRRGAAAHAPDQGQRQAAADDGAAVPAANRARSAQSLPLLRHVVIGGPRRRRRRRHSAFDALMAEPRTMTSRSLRPTPKIQRSCTSPAAPRGSPKGALHVHAAAVAHHATAASVFDLRPDDVYWCTADPGLGDRDLVRPGRAAAARRHRRRRRGRLRSGALVSDHPGAAGHRPLHRTDGDPHADEGRRPARPLVRPRARCGWSPASARRSTRRRSAGAARPWAATSTTPGGRPRPAPS